jgi:hypothetical protein
VRAGWKLRRRHGGAAAEEKEEEEEVVEEEEWWEEAKGCQSKVAHQKLKDAEAEAKEGGRTGDEALV